MDFVNLLVTCENGITIPDAIAALVRAIIFVIQVVVPILLILWGMLDFAKSIIGQDEDKIKAGQKKFIQRLIAGIIVFLIVSVVTFLIGLVGNLGGEGNQANGALSCVSQIISGN